MIVYCNVENCKNYDPKCNANCKVFLDKLQTVLLCPTYKLVNKKRLKGSR